jgi:hypothetical protein
MGENNISCPKCRQVVSGKFPPGSTLVCPACGSRFQAAIEPDAADFRPAAETRPAADLPDAATMPKVNPARRPPVRQAPAPAEPMAASPAMPQFVVADDRSPKPATAGTPAAPSIATGPPRPERSKKFGPLEIVKVVLGGAAGLGIGYLFMLWIQHRSAPDPAMAENKSARTASSPASGVEFPKFRPPAATPQVPVTPPFTPPPFGGFDASASSPIGPVSPVGPATSDPSPVPSPPENRPATAPAPAPQQALDGLAEVLKLPSLVDTTPAVISRVHVPEGKTLEVSFNSVAANVPADAAFFVEAKKETPLAWHVCFAPTLSGATNDKRVLGELTHQQGELKFAWRAPIEDAEIRKELGNCLMRLTCENVSKTSVLRSASEAPRLILDLDKEVGTHTLPRVDLPKEETVRLEFAALTSFPKGAALKDDKRVLKLKERTVIVFEQLPGAEIQLEFRRQKEGDLQLVLRPEFHENRTEEFPMTLSRLADLKKSMEKRIPEDEAKFVVLGKEIKALNQQLKDLGPRPGGVAFAAWQTKVNSLQSGISSKSSQMSRISRRLPELKARLAAVPEMERFLREMHQKAALEMRVYAECGDAKLVLIDAHLDPAASDQQPGT